MTNGEKCGYSASGLYVENENAACYEDGRFGFCVRKARRTNRQRWRYTGKRPLWDYPVFIDYMDGDQ